MRGTTGQGLTALIALLAMIGCTPSVAPPAPQAAAPPSAPVGGEAQPATSPPGRVQINMPYSGRGVADLAHYMASVGGVAAAEG